MSEAALTTGQLRIVRTRRISLLIVLCFIVIGTVIVMAALGTLLAPQDPGKQDLLHVLAKPSGAHWFGTDAIGRDVLSRVIAGARSAFIGPLVIALGAALIGSTLGLLAGYHGGWIDTIVMRYVDLMFALPGIVILIAVAGAFGGGYWLAVGLLVVLSTSFDIRLVRGATLEQVPRPYVEAAKTVGVANWRIMFLHIWPNVSSLVVAQLFLGFAQALISLAALSFLGLGQEPGTPDWGQMLSDGNRTLFVNPAGVFLPAFMIVVTATCMNLIGDWLYERLAGRGAGR